MAVGALLARHQLSHIVTYVAACKLVVVLCSSLCCYFDWDLCNGVTHIFEALWGLTSLPGKDPHESGFATGQAPTHCERTRAALPQSPTASQWLLLVSPLHLFYFPILAFRASIARYLIPGATALIIVLDTEPDSSIVLIMDILTDLQQYLQSLWHFQIHTPTFFPWVPPPGLPPTVLVKLWDALVEALASGSHSPAHSRQSSTCSATVTVTEKLKLMNL